MKRLFYVTNHLDDAEEISDQVHQAGIDDHHFYVISRDNKGLKQHHLHGSSNLKKTRIIAATDRAGLLVLIFAVITVGLFLFTDLIKELSTASGIVIGLLAVALLLFVIKYTGKSFDNYFIDMFEQRTKDGEVVIIIDVARDQAHRVETIMDSHPKAHFIADSTNWGSPLPD